MSPELFLQRVEDVHSTSDLEIETGVVDLTVRSGSLCGSTYPVPNLVLNLLAAASHR